MFKLNLASGLLAVTWFGEMRLKIKKMSQGVDCWLDKGKLYTLDVSVNMEALS